MRILNLFLRVFPFTATHFCVPRHPLRLQIEALCLLCCFGSYKAIGDRVEPYIAHLVRTSALGLHLVRTWTSAFRFHAGLDLWREVDCQIPVSGFISLVAIPGGGGLPVSSLSECFGKAAFRHSAAIVDNHDIAASPPPPPP